MEIIKGQKVTCKYGERRAFTCTDGTRINDFHDGLDIVSTTGSKDLLALYDGKVIYTTENDGTGCKTIVLAHGGVLPFGTVLLVKYCHCDSFKVKKGDIIKAGQPIAVIGATGHVTGVHCHLGMYAIPSNKWHSKEGTWYHYDHNEAKKYYELDPNLVLKLY